MPAKRRTDKVLELIWSPLPRGSILRVGTGSGELAHRLVALVWLFVHVAWSRRRRKRYHIGDQMKVILGGRSLVVVSRKTRGSPARAPWSSGRKGR